MPTYRLQPSARSATDWRRSRKVLKKLRRQFIAVSFTIAFIVVVCGIATLCGLSYSYQKRSSLSTMEELLNTITTSNGITNVANFYYNGSRTEKSGDYNGVIFVVITDANGNILTAGCTSLQNVAVDGNMLADSSHYAVGAKKERGNVKGYSLRYLREPYKGGYKIALADRSQELSSLYFQLRMYIFGGLALLLVAFLIIYFMSGRAIQPVAKSIEDQKRFIADASHELKTPVTVILANTDILESDLNATIGERKKWLDSTKSEANRMTKLVNEMLYLARADAGIQPKFQFRHISLSDLVYDCVLTSEALAYENHVHLKAKIADNVYLIGDEAKLKQVFIVLIENAMKYVERNGTIQVNLETTPLTRVARVSVINTGEPIPADKRDHLFERFFRAEESRTREKGGYGLGLSIAQNMVEQHNGEIGLEYSDEERGTCFCIHLPMEGNLKSPHVTQDNS